MNLEQLVALVSAIAAVVGPAVTRKLAQKRIEAKEREIEKLRDQVVDLKADKFHLRQKLASEKGIE